MHILSQCQHDYVNDSFTEEVLPQIQSCTFLSQLQGLAPGTIICTEFKEGTKFNR